MIMHGRINLVEQACNLQPAPDAHSPALQQCPAWVLRKVPSQAVHRPPHTERREDGR